MGPLLQLVQVPLDGIPSLRHVNHTTQLGVICKLAEGALDPAVCVIDEDTKQHWSHCGPMRDTMRRSILSLAEVWVYNTSLYSPPARRKCSHFQEGFFL